MRHALYIITLVLLSNIPAKSQDEAEPKFPQPGTTYEKNLNGTHIQLYFVPKADGFTIPFDTVTRSYRESYCYDTNPDTTGRTKVTDPDIIKRLLPAGAKMTMGPNEYTETTTLHSYRTPGGMTVIPDVYLTSVPIYFPDEGNLMLRNYWNDHQYVMINAYTGEDSWFDGDVFPSPDGSYRMVRRYNGYPDMNYHFQYRNPATGEYTDIGAFLEISRYGDPGDWFSFIRIYWVGNNVLGVQDWYDRYYLITFTPSSVLPTPQIKAPVQPAAPSLFEMEVRDPLTIDYGMTDREVTVAGHTFRYRKIPNVDFERLHEYYEPRQIRPWGVHGLDNIEAYLPDYTFRRFLSLDILYEIRDGDQFRLIMLDEQEGPYSYYPGEGILTYYGGHSSDQSINLRELTRADFNPGLMTYSPDMRFRVTGLHDGQDSDRLRLQRLDPYTGRYEEMCSFYDIFAELARPEFSYANYFYNVFWIGNTCYFRNFGYSTCSLTMPGQ